MPDDKVTGTDTHDVIVPGVGPTPTPLPFVGLVDAELSEDVFAENLEVACDGTTATNTPAHIAPSGSFAAPPSNQATVVVPNGTVYVNNKLIARNGDTAMTCNDPADAPNGTVVAAGTVYST